MRIAVFSDIHVRARFSTATLFDKRLLGFVNSVVIRSGYNHARIETGIRTILSNKPDLIVFCGDAVSTADPREFREAASRLRPLVESGIPILYSPGNHDRYVAAGNCYHAWQKFSAMLRATVPQNQSELYETDELRFFSLDSAVPCAPWMSCGVLNSKSLRKFENIAASEDKRPLVLLTHFPCWINNGKSFFSRRHGLHGYERLQKVIHDNPSVSLILSGHKHTPVERQISGHCYEVVTGSLTKHDVMRFVSFEQGRFTIDTWNDGGVAVRKPLVYQAN